MNGVLYHFSRGSGRTTRAILAAPRHGTYVVYSERSIHYTAHLAHSLGRADLTIRPWSWVLGNRWVGTDPRSIVLDHHIRESMNGHCRCSHERSSLAYFELAQHQSQHWSAKAIPRDTPIYGGWL